MTPVRRPPVLIFEPEHLGHQPSYVRALASWLERYPTVLDASFVVGRPLLERLRAEDGFDLERSPSVKVRVLSEREVSRCTEGGLARKAMARWRVLRRHLADSRALHAHVLFLDPFQLPLALGLSPGAGRTLSGILFRPSVHGLEGKADRRPRAERVRDALKGALYGRMLRNPSLRCVLTLDPLFPAYARRAFSAGAKVVALPDPIIEDVGRRGDLGADVEAAPGTGRVVFLMFGALAARKGVIEILEALLSLPRETRERVRVVLAGRIDADCAAAVAGLRRRLAEADPGTPSLCVVDRFLSTAELEWLVVHSDVVLATYRRHVGSSGALVWAARHGKPVIAQDYGLVGALVGEFHLGERVDATRPEAIAAAVSDLTRKERRQAITDEAQWQRFLAGRTADDFAAQLCEAVREAA
jgi:glycosyltransferase involved in cell wall biosynthesis